jgi:long-chain alkane monooxygenase
MSSPYVLMAFTMATVSHGNFGMWRNPADRTAEYTNLRYWVDLARLLDDGGFDGLFIADAVGQLDVFGGSARAALSRGIQTPVTDLLLAVSAMAAATEYLGFGITVSTTYESPYLVARKFSTLDHLTGGRIGWNIVTSLLDSAARNIIGRDRQIPHDERYAIADEFLEVTYKLWEGSWEPDAVVRDRERGVFTDPAKVHPIDHEGHYFSVPGAHLVEPSPQRTPVLFQAGTSPAGREFAAGNAELVFASDPRPDVLRANIDDIKRRAVAHGRKPDSIKFLTSIEIVVDSTDSAWYSAMRSATSVWLPTNAVPAPPRTRP